MSQTRNAVEYLQAYQGIRGRYDSVHGPNVAEARRRLSAVPAASADVESNLEAHERVYVINGFLEALNWRFNLRIEDGLPNLIPEAGVHSLDTLHRRFLDYLGYEKETGRPLLVVETKRRSATLPQPANAGRRSQGNAPSETISLGLQGESLSGDWDEWLATLKDYVRSTKEASGHCPRRVVITNGAWLIVFINPEDSFLESGSKSSSKIIVFKAEPDQPPEIESRYVQVFEVLEYQRVLGEVGTLEPAQIQFHLTATDVAWTLRGLRVKYSDTPALHHRRAPAIRVSPMLFLGTINGSSLKVETGQSDHYLPFEYGRLLGHLQDVEDDADDLLAVVNQSLESALSPRPIGEHYKDDEVFARLAGVTMDGEDFLLVTGNKTHYLLPEPSVPDCSFHSWTACESAHVATDPPAITRRSTEMRSFFVSGEKHHCAHRSVLAIKREPIDENNRARCGPRSGKNMDPFCEIFGFERQSCCRTCVFEEVCSGSQVFRLPCQRPAPVTPPSESNGG